MSAPVFELDEAGLVAADKIGRDFIRAAWPQIAATAWHDMMDHGGEPGIVVIPLRAVMAWAAERPINFVPGRLPLRDDVSDILDPRTAVIVAIVGDLAFEALARDPKGAAMPGPIWAMVASGTPAPAEAARALAN